MITREMIIAEAKRIGFDDIGFTTAEPFEEHRKMLIERRADYEWAASMGLDIFNATDPKKIMPDAKSVIVVLDMYFRQSFPASMEGHFGRCYLDDDRVTRDGLSKKIKALRSFLRDSGIDSKVPFDMPHRVAAARAGLGTFGKNCLLYANNVARGSSWILPVAIVVNAEFEPGAPTIGVSCPSWCRNACIAACPTRALKSPCVIDPRKCISYLSYYGEGITPMDLREPMGMFVYGCDRCQNVCPRNSAWMAQELPVNRNVEARAADFELTALLHMDIEYFKSRIWPHMFYMSADDLWRWKMNVARVMGNSLDDRYVPHLERAFGENGDERVLGMIAWALGRIGGVEAVGALKRLGAGGSRMVAEEIRLALDASGR
jgi:epoxyqueuosine reductase